MLPHCNVVWVRSVLWYAEYIRRVVGKRASRRLRGGFFNSAASASTTSWLKRRLSVSHSLGRDVTLNSSSATARALTVLGPCAGKVNTDNTLPGRSSVMSTTISPVRSTLTWSTDVECGGEDLGDWLWVAKVPLKLLLEESMRSSSVSLARPTVLRRGGFSHLTTKLRG